MGWGDELIVTAEARQLQQQDPRPVLVIDRFNQPRWHPIWEGNPRFARARNGKYQELQNCSGIRPYIAGKTATRWQWKPYQCEPGEIYLTAEEKRFAQKWAGHVLIEPNVKANTHANKDWGFARWEALTLKLGLPWLQVGPSGTRRVSHARYAPTATFREACAILAVSKAFIGTEGGLHHAAAALGIPAVVIFGGFIAPENTGYVEHINLFTGGRACGWRLPCQHCREAMASITVEQVAHHLETILCR